jgi:hypothetical protein
MEVSITEPSLNKVGLAEIGCLKFSSMKVNPAVHPDMKLVRAVEVSWSVQGYLVRKEESLPHFRSETGGK